MQFGIAVPREAAFDVVGFGLNAVDYLCVVPEGLEFGSKAPILRFERSGGGQAASAMVACARLGLRAKYVGKVGDDEAGAFSLESIRSEGVDVRDVVVVPRTANQFAFIIVDAGSGERTILWHRPPQIATAPPEVTPERVAVGRALLVDGHDAPAAVRAAAIARERGIPVVLDAETVKDGTAELVAATDVVVASSRFPALFTGRAGRREALHALKEAGPTVVAMTLGKDGALALGEDGSEIHSPAYAVNVVDTTGSGDVFHGAFLVGLVSGWTVERTLDFSNAAAAIKCASVGGRGGARSRDEVFDLMKRHGRL
jgi:sulfofructose kinase